MRRDNVTARSMYTYDELKIKCRFLFSWPLPCGGCMKIGNHTKCSGMTHFATEQDCFRSCASQDSLDRHLAV